MRLTEKVHEFLKNHLHEGDHAIDATAGNGYDTLFLAEQVGLSGKVIAIDIQDCAIQSTRKKLEAAGLMDRVRLVSENHALALRKLILDNHEKVAAITFNLGYLPGSDRAIQTQVESTEEALAASVQLLANGGSLCVTAYRGHSGGSAEAEGVEAFMRRSQPEGHSVDCYEPVSCKSPPILWVLKKNKPRASLDGTQKSPSTMLGLL